MKEGGDDELFDVLRFVPCVVHPVHQADTVHGVVDHATVEGDRAFRSARRARGVDEAAYVSFGDIDEDFPGRLLFHQPGEGDGPFPSLRTGHENVLKGRKLARDRLHPLPERALDDGRGTTRVLELTLRLLGGQPGIDDDRYGPDLRKGKVTGKGLRDVGGHDGHPVALPDTVGLVQPVGHIVHYFIELVVSPSNVEIRKAPHLPVAELGNPLLGELCQASVPARPDVLDFVFVSYGDHARLWPRHRCLDLGVHLLPRYRFSLSRGV